MTNKWPYYIVDIKDVTLKHWAHLVLQTLIRHLRDPCFHLFAENRYRTASRCLTLSLSNNIPSGAAHDPAHTICSQNIVQFYGTTIKGDSFKAKFHETYKCSTVLCADFLWSLSKFDSKCEISGQRIIYPVLNWTKLISAQKYFAKTS
jgi:hypothetical protein